LLLFLLLLLLLLVYTTGRPSKSVTTTTSYQPSIIPLQTRCLSTPGLHAMSTLLRLVVAVVEASSIDGREQRSLCRFISSTLRQPPTGRVLLRMPAKCISFVPTGRPECRRSTGSRWSRKHRAMRLSVLTIEFSGVSPVFTVKMV